MFQYFTENDQRSDAQEKTEKQVCNLTLKRTDAAPGVVVLSLLTWDLMKYVYYCSSQAHSLETFIERQPQVGSFFLSFSVPIKLQSSVSLGRCIGVAMKHNPPSSEAIKSAKLTSGNSNDSLVFALPKRSVSLVRKSLFWNLS